MEWGFPQAARTLAQGNPLDPLQAIDANRKFQRFDQLAVDLPEPSGPNPAAAAAIQETDVAIASSFIPEL
jgi:DNA-binding MurR/RpiR family transcriptional regulator